MLRQSAFVFLLYILVLPVSVRAQTTVSDSLWKNYLFQNEQEQRLIEYKDNEEALKLKLEQLNIINDSRLAHSAGEVRLDILASRLANKMCKEAALNNYTGHWNMNGEKPYQRYAFAGGLDHVSENAAGKSSTSGFEQNKDVIVSTMKELHRLFMAEQAPNNGHKLNCIDKTHNYVGIGYYLGKTQFRYYEEFIDRYYTFEQVPLKVKVGQEVSIKVRPESGFYFCYLVAYKDKFPKKMTPLQLNLKKSYKDYTGKAAIIIKPWSFPNYRSDGSYKIPLRFKKPGLYYIHLYQDKKEYRTPKNFSTEGKVQGSGIVIKVEK